MPRVMRPNQMRSAAMRNQAPMQQQRPMLGANGAGRAPMMGGRQQQMQRGGGMMGGGQPQGGGNPSIWSKLGGLAQGFAGSQFGQQLMGHAGNWLGNKIFNGGNQMQEDGSMQPQGGFFDGAKQMMGQYAQQRGMGQDYDNIMNMARNPMGAMRSMGQRGMQALDDHIAQNGFSGTMGQMANGISNFARDPGGSMRNMGNQAMNYAKQQGQQYLDDRGYSQDINQAQNIYNQGKQAFNQGMQGGQGGGSMVRRLGQMADNAYMRNRPQNGYFGGGGGQQQQMQPQGQQQGGYEDEEEGQYAHGGYVTHHGRPRYVSGGYVSNY